MQSVIDEFNEYFKGEAYAEIGNGSLKITMGNKVS